LPEVGQVRGLISSVMTRQREAGRGAAVLLCHEILQNLDGLDRLLEGTSPTVGPRFAQRRSVWDWFKNLFGVKSCTNSDATGARVNQNGDIVEANGNVIHCPAGTHVRCDPDNNLWVCAQ
jgi:hypothetical protein